MPLITGLTETLPRSGECAKAPNPIRLGLVGIGKIARDQHLPAIAANPRLALAAAASRHGEVAQVRTFRDIEQMIAGCPDLVAVSLCAPPSVRAAMARAAIAARLHVMLEKPPGVAVSEILDLVVRAEQQNITLFATWHSREAGAVATARAWLAKKDVTAVRVRWLEDVRVWHPGQDWIWEPGGFGVFDPGINALSILTHILERPLVAAHSVLFFPANRDMPMRANLTCTYGESVTVDVALSFCHTGVPCWDIEVDTSQGVLRLTSGGSRLDIDGREIAVPPSTEYANLYERFATLIHTGQSDVDVAPLQLVADAFLCGRRVEIEPFL